MIDKYQQKTQTELEQHAKELLLLASKYPNKTREELFGRPIDWVINIGGYQLLLIPFLQEWCWYDRVHNDWPFTGYKIGEMTFYVGDGQLMPPPKISFQSLKQSESKRLFKETPSSQIGSPVSPLPETKKICQNCGSPIESAKKFCANCGTPVPITPPLVPSVQPQQTAPARTKNFCPSCGKPLKPNAKFCRSCGFKI
ncbi:MAG: zinc ribbon domain-containing protein [Methanoregulaceae archaeon]|jgi:predicted nucleic acid-binding Zn ribbon protein